MIFEWLLQLWATFLEVLAGNMPDVGPAGEVLITAHAAAMPVLIAVHRLGNWFPWPDLALAIGITSGVWLAWFLFKVLRVILGYLIPGSGGS